MKIAIRTFGCSLNQADSEAMAGQLEINGGKIVNEKEADIVIINSCTVKQRAENKFLKSIQELESKGKKVVLAGCVPQGDRKLVNEKLKNYSIIGTNHLHDVQTVLHKTNKGEIVQLLNKKQSEKRLEIPTIRKNKEIEIIPISEGCMEHCNYCKTKHARGKQVSYRPLAIKEKAQKAIKEEVKELWLTSQDCGSYGLDIGVNLPEMVKQIATLEGNFKIRIGMANPTHLKEILPDLIEVYNNPKVYKFLHIPIQAGNNKVLKDMNRTYTVEEFKKIIKEIRKEIPNITIATDIICGYPTETEKQFEETIKLVKEMKFSVINISRFWPRPGTQAAKLEYDGNVTLKRSKKLTKLFETQTTENLQKYVGTKQKITWTKQVNEKHIGRTNNYILVEADAKKEVVEIKAVKEHHLVA